jgi:hypothetical protein
VLACLSLNEADRALVRQALERQVRERAGGAGPAILENAVHVGWGNRQ